MPKPQLLRPSTEVCLATVMCLVIHVTIIAAEPKPLPVRFPLKPGHELALEFDASILPFGRLFDVNPSNGTRRQLTTVQELLQIVGPISSADEAIAFVQFLTDYPTRFILKKPFSGIEPSETIHPAPEELLRLMTPTQVEENGEDWIIERDLLLYPSAPEPARLVRTRERVSKTGDYYFKVGRVLLEGVEVNQLLPYYK
ncbi:MAG: hypothetical protein HY352_06415 [Candidatus Omnitrophica bacterium]|nr:hypothetical protein [Candidatus Omnitrophota bacterium]